MTLLRACYDLARSPPTYDFAAFLCQVEIERLARGARDVEIVFAPGPVGGFRQDALWPRSIEERWRLFWRIALPMARLLPSCRSVRLLPNRDGLTDVFGFGHVLHGLRFQASANAAGVRPLRPYLKRTPISRLVTITLREAEHWPERNSNVAAWLEAAIEIKRRGYDVVVIRDTLHGSDGLPAVACDPRAPFDLHYRAELYASATVNLGVSNGPLWMALAMDLPVVMLRPVCERSGGMASAQQFASCGIRRGGQMPGAPDWQRLVWTDDSSGEILAAFNDFIGGVKKKDAA
jgi:hypothetical protein